MQDVNPLFEEFAAIFCGELQEDSDVVHRDRLDRTRLDYSVDSLKTVDEYLILLHSNHPIQFGQDQKWIKTIMWGGAYVGEVIRHNAIRKYSWVDFHDFVVEYPQTTHILGEQRQLGYTALLTPGGGAFSLPINKVLRFIYDGPEDSVWFYATCEVREPRQGIR